MMWLFGTGEVDVWVITRWIMGHNDVTFWDRRSWYSRDELWDKTRSLFWILEDDISIFRKVIIWKILRWLQHLLQEWRKPPRKVSNKRTFGTPDQGQTLDVWESQTTESALRWGAPYFSVSYSWSCSWSYSWSYSWTHELGIKTMASLILDHVTTDYWYLGTNTERKICFWNCPRTRSC